ncbi:glycosyltransferase family A protein [Geobacter sp.]|uniref:glycosyltransferase family 2 protein n=1 Tax=Geobacter sp. TaxID=46610 RepID=UPI002638292F|nr:glycosyltransferase family A protein [Geobacter sp.]
MTKRVTPSISVVIPLFNKADFVEEAIASVQKQSLPAAEIIVIDDGSTDGSAACVERLAVPQLRLIRQRNAGVASARNCGIQEAKGDIVAFLDADDRYLPGFIAAIHGLAADFPQAGLLGTAYRRFWDDGRFASNPLHKSITLRRGLVPNFYTAWCRSAFTSTSSLAARRAVFSEPSQRFPVGEKLGEDQDLWFRIAERYPVAFDPAVCAEYRMGVPASATTSSSVQILLPCYIRLSERLERGDVPEFLQSGARRLLASHLLNVARARLVSGDIRGAWQMAADSRAAGNTFYRLRTGFLIAVAAMRCGGLK